MSFTFHLPALRTFYPVDVALVFCTVIGNAELLFLCAFTKTAAAYRAVNTHVLAGTVFFLAGAGSVIVKFLGKRDGLVLWTQVMIFFLNIFKAIGTTFKGSMLGYKTLDTLLL